jgi:hypothetical protein
VEELEEEMNSKSLIMLFVVSAMIFSPSSRGEIGISHATEISMSASEREFDVADFVTMRETRKIPDFPGLNKSDYCIASTRKALEAAIRVFEMFDFRGLNKEQVRLLLGDPFKISDMKPKHPSDPSKEIIYLYDDGGLGYVVHLYFENDIVVLVKSDEPMR